MGISKKFRLYHSGAAGIYTTIPTLLLLLVTTLGIYYHNGGVTIHSQINFWQPGFGRKDKLMNFTCMETLMVLYIQIQSMLDVALLW